MKKLGRPRTYDFSVIRKGKWVAIPCDNIISCRASLRYYAELHGLKVATNTKNGVFEVYKF
jgi:hypothetical protein